MPNVKFERCRFGELDARSTSLSRCTFIDCPAIGKLQVDQQTVCTESLPPVSWLQEFREGEVYADFFGEDQCRARLFSEEDSSQDLLGDASETALALEKLAVRLARRAARVFWFTEIVEDADDRGMRTIKRDQLWGRLLELLENEDLIRREDRPRQYARLQQDLALQV